jgi:CRISPR/Cas system CMR-associated protein Cmr3 (group 5 of RAMP superfamily)
MLNTVVFPSTKSSGFMQHKLAAVFQFSISFLIAVSIALFSMNVHAAQVKITFDPSPDSRTEGHFFYYGQSENFSKTNYIDKINLEKLTDCEVSNLQEGTTYYFAATAYDQYWQRKCIF